MVSNTVNRLGVYRKSIDKIDNKIFRLLVKRLIIVKRIGSYKRANKIKIFDKARESQILKKIKKESKKYKMNEEYINNIFKSIMKTSKMMQSRLVGGFFN